MSPPHPPHHHTHPPSPPDPDERLRALEEGLGFAEHRGDQLAAEVERLFAEFKRLTERMDILERRMNMAGGEPTRSD